MPYRKDGVMNKFYNPAKETWTGLLARPTQETAGMEASIEAIFQEVKIHGDEALRKYTREFDGVDLKDLIVTSHEMKERSKGLKKDLKDAIRAAKSNIEKFHSAQTTQRLTVETTKGVLCWQEKRPIEKVGLYIPGGTAPLFSTILMLAIPAQIAGCREVVLCTPPNKEGNVDPAICYTAQLCGIDRIIKVGGIQAIAGMTFGTPSVPRVYKLFGPGNQYVTAAKQMATKYGVAIDMPAGPSELLVLADDSADATFVAADLLSQAEHGVDSQVLLVSTSRNFINRVALEVAAQLKELPRKAIAEKAIENSKLIFVEDDETAMALINEYSPEHFIICSDMEAFYAKNIQNAGSVFLGNYSPESAGDYASGTNHTLPTNGYARQYSGVNLDSFMKSITFQKITKKGIEKIGRDIEIMAAAEGLQGHKNAVTLRLNSLKNN